MSNCRHRSGSRSCFARLIFYYFLFLLLFINSSPYLSHTLKLYLSLSLLQLWKPHFLIAVPRLFETIHKTAVSTLRQQSAASESKRRLISILTACTQLYLRFYKTWANLLIRAKKPSPIERVSSHIFLYFFYVFYCFVCAVCVLI